MVRHVFEFLFCKSENWYNKSSSKPLASRRVVNYSASENFRNKALPQYTATCHKPSWIGNLPTVSWPGILALRLFYSTSSASSRSLKTIPILPGVRGCSRLVLSANLLNLCSLPSPCGWLWPSTSHYGWTPLDKCPQDDKKSLIAPLWLQLFSHLTAQWSKLCITSLLKRNVMWNGTKSLTEVWIYYVSYFSFVSVSKKEIKLPWLVPS